MIHDPAFDVGARGGWLCERCQQQTGNTTNGHFWTWCGMAQLQRRYHFCCPGDCELEGLLQITILTVWPEHLPSACPDLQNCSAHTEWHQSWMERCGDAGQA